MQFQKQKYWGCLGNVDCKVRGKQFELRDEKQQHARNPDQRIEKQAKLKIASHQRILPPPNHSHQHQRFNLY